MIFKSVINGGTESSSRRKMLLFPLLFMTLFLFLPSCSEDPGPDIIPAGEEYRTDTIPVWDFDTYRITSYNVCYTKLLRH